MSNQKDTSSKLKEAAEQFSKEFVEELKKQMEQANTARLQVMADFENFRRRMEDERSKFGMVANMMLLQVIMEMIDEVDRASGDTEMTVERAKEVLALFKDKLVGAATSNGLQQIEVKPGDDFDSETMEAITSVPVEDKKMAGKVVDVISTGFKHTATGEVVKPAKVVTGKQ